MGKIGVIMMERFEEQDYIDPIQFLRNEGHELIHLGLEQGILVEGRSRGVQVKIDQSIRDASADTLDALLIPRGYTLEGIKTAKDVVELVKNFLEAGKPVWRSESRRINHC